ncbi:SpvB/TcaC N-terminal domain-containing protein [Leptolyngbya sp. KIOST-1]|uniref:SpvB/TcaC N-terminal domain-containing protein n=1 Tax=Leptolyngbya sp. KIOST-1 TaxID=1229172 RepID=UPI0012E09F1C|nr:SpvB/TcaC N-terminal domain-containing protein [Leptolyngbya sp. KIOST-1]
MSNKSGTSSQVISLPKGGGALHGIGETFSPDLFTGTGNFTVPIAIPPGRNGFQPELNLVYSTGNGNGDFGLGWGLSIPGVSRKTSKGIPRYDDDRDVFILSGAEDLVPVKEEHFETDRRRSVSVTYRPRTEGLFARIQHHHIVHLPNGPVQDYWEVRSKDGLVSHYGTAELPVNADNTWVDPAVIANPGDRSHIFSWSLTQTRDPFGNVIVYNYEGDTGTDDPHHWDQLYLKQIRYADYGDRDNPEFLVSVTFEYEDRPDPFSDYRSGFEIRTRRRCQRIKIRTHADQERLTRTYQFVYLDQRTDLGNLEALLPLNGVSLLSQVKVSGHDGDTTEDLPPLEFDYSRFEPQGQDFFPVEGRNLPARSLGNPELELADLFGNGLPAILEINGTVRYWRNLGNGRFDLPRSMKEAPAGLQLADQGVQLIDANGDGRIDLLVTRPGLSGYFPLQFGGLWDRKSFQPYRMAPSFNLEDPAVQLVDLTGDGVTDAIRSGSWLECFFNDPQEGWGETTRGSIEGLSNINFSDPRVKWGDMSGDGLQDIVLVYDGNIEYWPNLGYGIWGKRMSMRNSPRFHYGYDPRRILIGDVDGDGLADLVYVDNNQVILWINQSGNGWSGPIAIKGTPSVTDMDAVRLVDLLGTGVAGVLWSADLQQYGRNHLYFLDFTGGVKPYLLHQMDNHMGAVTKVEYQPSTKFYLEDEQQRQPWKTPLPFPVLTVAKVEVIDEISKGKLTTEYRYHHGYWDGAEREFRGFGRVDQRDTEVFEDYISAELFADVSPNDRLSVSQREAEAREAERRAAGTIRFEFDPQREAERESLNRLRFFDTDPVAMITPPHIKPQDRQAWLEDWKTKSFSPPLETRTWFHLGPVGEEFGDWDEVDYRDEYWAGDAPLLPDLLPNARASRQPIRDHRRHQRDAIRTLRGRMLRTELYALDGSPRQDRPYTVTESLHSVREESSPGADNGEQRPIFFPHTLAQRTTQWERGEEPMTQFSFTEDYDTYGQPRRQIQMACPRGWHRLEDRPTTGDNPYLATRTETVYVEPEAVGVYIHDRVAKTTTYEFKETAGRTLSAIKTNPTLKLIGQTLNFYDGEAFLGCDEGCIEQFGALVRSESLVLTEAILDEAYPTGTTLPDTTGRPIYLTDEIPVWTTDYPDRFQRLVTRAGYRYRLGVDGVGEGYFVATEQRQYDFQRFGQGRGLVTATRDPLGHETTITYDSPYQLLPEKVKDPVELETEAKYNYRVLQPERVIDPNGNVTEFKFSPLGLLTETWVKGKGNHEGDQTRPSTRLDYDFLAFEKSPPGNREPIFVRTMRHIHHDTETNIPLPKRDETIESRDYSDGFGRLLQTRTQGETVRFGDAVFGGGESVLPADQAAGFGAAVVGIENLDAAKPNVVVSGWQIYDNKGRVVEKYEPFFSTGWEYAPPVDRELEQKVTMFYDPRGQVIRTVNPDGSEQRVIYGIPADLATPENFSPTPWEAYTYDANDNAGRTHAQTAPAYEHHWNTPSSIVIDGLGRTVEAVERNRAKRPNSNEPLPVIEEYRTRSAYDIRGNLLTVTDALGREAFRYVYDLANNPLRVISIDAGVRRTVLNAAGNEIERRDSKGALILQAYDALNRPTDLWARDGGGQPLSLREHLVYGDSPEANLTVDQAKAANLRGKLYQHYDEAGLLRFESYDFKGNGLEKVRRVIQDRPILDVLNHASVDWANQAYRVDWQPPGSTPANEAARLLDAQEFCTSATYDALNRVKAMQYPQDVERHRQVLKPDYNRAGALERVTLDDQPYVERMAYNAKGQRVLIAYGNGVMTRYAYDPQTFRLVRLLTSPFEHSGGDSLTYQPKGTAIQDLGYDYDLAGNILRIRDRTPGSGVHDMPLGPNALNRDFTYDPLYRLISATGRECQQMPQPRPWADVATQWQDNGDCGSGFYPSSPPTPNQNNAPNLTCEYTEEYAYDPAGNMVEMRHWTGHGAWKRQFGMGELSPVDWDAAWRNYVNGQWDDPLGNQLTHVVDSRVNGAQSPIVSQTHFFDANGNLIRENQSRQFEWDHNDRLRSFRTQAGTAEPSVIALYLYDASGQRVKKLVWKGANRYEVTVYVDGVFELHYQITGGQRQENNTLHVMDDQSRIALVRVGKPLDERNTTPAVQYHLGDHLGSSQVVMDETGGLINREEFTPYGETSFGSFRWKRYRFTGKERDDESGLYYHGARYYAPWLKRWITTDPAGTLDGINLFLYAQNKPLTLVDPGGTTPIDPATAEFARKEGFEITPGGRLSITMHLGDFDKPETLGQTESTSGIAEIKDTVPEIADVEENPLGSYLPGTKAGFEAAQFWSDLVLEGEKQGGFPGKLKLSTGWIFGFCASLWTPETAFETAITLGTASLGAAANAGARASQSAAFGFRGFFLGRASYPTTRSLYWSARAGGSEGVGATLHHWLIPQRLAMSKGGFIPDRIVNAGWNLLELPNFTGWAHRTLGLNQYMGFAMQWGSKNIFWRNIIPKLHLFSSHQLKAYFLEQSIRLGILASPKLGFEIGEYVGTETMKQESNTN